MRRLRLLHLGDVHYPEAHNERVGDIKDDAMPRNVIEQMVQIPLQEVIRQAAREITRDPVNAYLISGDLTSKGDLAAYEQCIEFLLQALPLRDVAGDRVHAVPGNHDFDRTLVDEADSLKKFTQIKEAWIKRGLPILAVSGVRSSIVKSGTTAAALFSLNSCLGCGEKRHLPAKIADEMAAVFSGYISKVGLLDSFELIAEQLDSPGFAQQEIDEVVTRARQLPERTVPVVLAHHNILPQALPRLQIYTEVMNAGRMRSAFTTVKRTVIYCHGHIHEDVIEVVELPDSSDCRIASIAAPELRRGFNIIQIEYGEKRGDPLGCKVQRFAYDTRTGQVTPREAKISLCKANYQRAISLGHSALREILTKLNTKTSRFEDAFDILKWPDDEQNRRRFADALEEACWFDLVDIENSERAPDAWWITKTAR